ncbi:MAG: hypothetical protein P1T08_06410 [Acidimicrobiia bacterium]|nr:hypothetical protein [Acidimicrobiia bacterium]
MQLQMEAALRRTVHSYGLGTMHEFLSSTSVADSPEITASIESRASEVISHVSLSIELTLRDEAVAMQRILWCADHLKHIYGSLLDAAAAMAAAHIPEPFVSNGMKEQLFLRHSEDDKWICTLTERAPSLTLSSRSSTIEADMTLLEAALACLHIELPILHRSTSELTSGDTKDQKRLEQSRTYRRFALVAYHSSLQERAPWWRLLTAYVAVENLARSATIELGRDGFEANIVQALKAVEERSGYARKPDHDNWVCRESLPVDVQVALALHVAGIDDVGERIAAQCAVTRARNSIAHRFERDTAEIAAAAVEIAALLIRIGSAAGS